MIHKIKSKFKSKEQKNLLTNFISLSVIQGANFLLPLITFPYLVKTLGVEKFGLIIFAQAFIVYFSILVDYGFNLSGIREVSTHRNNITKLTQIFNSIMIARFILAIISLLLMTIIIFSFDKFSGDWKLYYLTFGMVIGTLLFPSWFFQGMERMKYISVLTIIAKTIFTLSVFIFVQSPEDYLYVPLLNALGFIVVGFLSLFLIVRDFGIHFKLQRYQYIKTQFLRGWYIFISKISTSLYMATNTMLLGFFTNDATVGYYSIAEKSIRIITSIFVPLYQAIYPYVTQLVKHSKENKNHFLNNIFQLTVFVSGIIWLISYIFSTPLLHFAFGENIDLTINIFKILSPLIMILPIAFLLFNVILLSHRMDKYFAKIYITGGVLNLIFVFTFFQILESKSVGIALSLLCSEIVITFLAVKILYDKKIVNISKNLIKIIKFTGLVILIFILFSNTDFYTSYSKFMKIMYNLIAENQGNGMIVER